MGKSVRHLEDGSGEERVWRRQQSTLVAGGGGCPPEGVRWRGICLLQRGQLNKSPFVSEVFSHSQKARP